MLISPDQNEMSVTQMTELAEAGNVTAQYYLGMSYYIGLNVAKSQAQAINWWTKAAEQYSPEAQYLLGQCYYFGDGVMQDLAASVRYFKSAAEQGHLQAQINLAAMLLSGTGVPKNENLARYCLERAAKGGSASAAVTYARMLEDGVGGDRDAPTAYEWFLKAGELDPTNMDSAYSAAVMIADRRVTGKEPAEALPLLEKAGEAGHMLAQHMLGWVYENGTLAAQDYAKSWRWYERAANQGHPQSHFQLGMLSLQDHVGEGGAALMLEHLTKAAEADLPEAVFALGMLYREGKKTSRSLPQAVRWFGRLAERGNLDAMFMLASCLQEVGESPAKVVVWYTRASEKGHVPSQNNLALLHHKGDSAVRDLKKALHWYRECVARSKDMDLVRNALNGIDEILAAESSGMLACPAV